MVVCHTGTPEEAERDLAPFKEWGSPLVVEVGRMPYPVMNTLLDDGYPTGSLNYWLSSFTCGLPDGLIDTAVERFATVPSPMTAILLEHFHGAVTRVGVTRHGGAAPRRGLEPRAPVASGWIRPTTEENIALDARHARGASPSTSTARRWLNYLADDQGDDAIRAAYGPNYDRLVEVKRRYDPRNVFRQNHNIVP